MVSQKELTVPQMAMVRCLLFSILFLYSVTYCLDLRVMSFNVWMSGGWVKDGIQKIVKHIQLVDPDIVSLQEVISERDAQKILELLPAKWSIKYGNSNNAVLTKHKFDHSSFFKTRHSDHILIEITEKIKINFWAVHAEWRNYGPYAVFGKSVKTVEEVMAGEETEYGTGNNNSNIHYNWVCVKNSKRKPTEVPVFKNEIPKLEEDVWRSYWVQGRASDMMDIVQSPAMQSDLKSIDTVPIIVAGDFNTPSHEDWIEETRDMHAGWIVEWPTTKILADKLEMTDSFRYVNRNVTSNPGFTWSTCDKYNKNLGTAEPQDRIDFIFYRGPLVPISSLIYSGNDPITPIPNQRNNDWPSDHAAVVTDFRINL